MYSQYKILTMYYETPPLSKFLMPVLSPDKGGRRSTFKYFEFLIEYTFIKMISL